MSTLTPHPQAIDDTDDDLWSITEDSLELDLLGWSESVFALSNGHIGLRGNLDEGEPYGTPGTYLNSVYEQHPLPMAEAGYGFPESGQTIINVTNGKLMRLLVDDEPFDVRYGELRAHRRRLDLRAGTLERVVEWVSPAGQAVRLSSTRMVSFSQRAVAAIAYEVEVLGEPARIVVQSELVANEPQPRPRGSDPRQATPLESPLTAVDHSELNGAVVLVHRTNSSHIGIAAGMAHRIDGPATTQVRHDVAEDLGRSTVTTVLDPGQKLRIVKYLGYGWSTVRSQHALRDQVSAAISAASQTGWDGLVVEQRAFLDDFWDSSGVELEGDDELLQATRFAMFHALQSGARGEQRPIGAKGLTGSGYDGHTFWDSETFVLPFLQNAMPKAAADVLRWRLSTLDFARERARALGLEGATFPWRTIRGEECSGYWPAGTAAFHVNSSIAGAAMRYVECTDDLDFEREVGTELLVETARLWHSLGHFGGEGAFRIDGVTGPDEYTAVVDNNVYTNLTARRNLLGAVAACRRHHEVAEHLGVAESELVGWTAAAEAMHVPFDERLGVHPQSDGFTDHQIWDFAQTDDEHYPLLAHFPYFDLYRKQVVKQADLVLAMMICPEEFTPEQKLADFDYYEAITVRDSSLSSVAQAVMAAEVGHLGLAYRYARENALMDLKDLHRNTADGLHIAGSAGAWTVLVAGFAGLRVRNGLLHFAPRLPTELTALAVNLRHRGRRVRIEISGDDATYTLVAGDPLELAHHEGHHHLGSEPLTLPIPTLAPRREPNQPFGREPVA